ncbi:MAG: response regulator [Bacteroidota bacterium]
MDKKKISILHLEEKVIDHELLKELLMDSGLNVDMIRVETKNEFLHSLRSGLYDLVISDYSLPSYDGISALGDTQAVSPDIPFIIVSGNIGEEYAVESLKLGATDYILKNNLKRLPSAIQRALIEAEEQSQLKTLEIELREREQFITKVTEMSPNIIFVYDLRNDKVVWVNGAMRQILGYEPEKLLRLELFVQQLMHQEDYLKFAAHIMWKVPVSNGEIIDFSARLKNSSGEWRWLHSRCAVFSTDADGKPLQTIWISEDITEKIELEAKLFRSQRIESIGELAGGIAHDLNNVFGPMLLAIPLLRRQVTEEPGIKFLNMIEGGIHRGTNMVKQILMFAKGIHTEQTILQPKQLLTELEQIIKETFPRSIAVSLAIEQEVDPVQGNHTQLYQVLLNLCVNARDAMPQSGAIIISCANVHITAAMKARHRDAVVGPYVRISVRDTGSGIPPEIIEKIFDPFFTTKEAGKGTGIGLSTVRTLIQKHKGFTDVESTPGKGSMFSIYLPSASHRTLPDVQKPSAIPLGHGELIMVVDDETSLLQIAKEALESNRYKTITANDGAEAIALFAKQADEIKLVICDMSMPLLDGAKTIPVLKKLNPMLKVVIASGSSFGYPEDQLMKDYNALRLEKPYTMEKMLNTVSAALTSS